MDTEPQLPPLDEWDSAQTDLPEFLDTLEPKGFALLERRYGESPEQLAFNTTLAILVLIKETENTIVTGQDASVMGEKSQEFLDKVLQALSAKESHFGYEHLLQRFSVYGKCSTEFLTSRMASFTEDKQAFLDNFYQLDIAQRTDHQERLRDDLNLLRSVGKKYLCDALVNVPLTHEGGTLEGVDFELFCEFLEEFRDEDPHAEIPEDGSFDDLDWQMHKRFVYEAHYIFDPFSRPLADA